MTSDWTGFTDEELRRLQTGQDDGKRRGSARPKSQQPMKPKSRPQRAVPPMKKESELVEPIEPSARLSTQQTAMATPQPDLSHNAAPASATIPYVEEPNKTTHNDVKPTPTDDKATPTAKLKEKGSELLSDADGINRDMTNLEQYQQQQKMIEELNKQKRKMLTSALAVRQKAASKEASKLKTLNAELSKLDQSLNVDVSLIRDRIELATREYAEASKRNKAAEEEYIAAKINLHKKSELKEQLTEHLYAIIHQNELRKAKKLAEMMKQLELVPEDSSEAADSLIQLPSLSLFGNVQTVASGNLKQVSSPEAPTSPEANKPKISIENPGFQAIESENKTEVVSSEVVVTDEQSEEPVVASDLQQSSPTESS